MPEPLLDAALNQLSRWQLLQKMRDHLWQRSREYVQRFTSRPKWWTAAGNLTKGRLCLLKHETTSSSRWPLARIVRVHPGDDDQVHVVTVYGRWRVPTPGGKDRPTPMANDNCLTHNLERDGTKVNGSRRATRFLASLVRHSSDTAGLY